MLRNDNTTNNDDFTKVKTGQSQKSLTGLRITVLRSLETFKH